jgi:succinyl-diaminopimelate desuccinylase
MSDEPSGALTVNLGLLEGGNDYIRGSLDIRYPVTASRDNILAALEDSFAKGGFQIESLSHKPPLYKPKDDVLVQTLTRVFREKTGQDLEPISTGGGTYARALPNVLAFGPCLPGGVYAVHQANENIEIDHLLLLSQIYAQAMYELATPK